MEPDPAGPGPGTGPTKEVAVETAVVIRAARFLADHAADPLTLGDVADHVGYSPFHLARTFEREVGTPPGRLLAAHRFQRAKRLLLDAEDRVIDVCYAAGFTAPGTFTRRFTAYVGASPTGFRRLPDVLAAAPPRPVAVPGGARHGAVVTGSVVLTPEAAALLGDAAAVYVGLFRRRAARGVPVSGAMLDGPGEFSLCGVPPGTYWLMASALRARADYGSQLVPERTIAGCAPAPLWVAAGAGALRRDVVADVAPEWSPPVLVALPGLASPAPRSMAPARSPVPQFWR